MEFQYSIFDIVPIIITLVTISLNFFIGKLALEILVEAYLGRHIQPKRVESFLVKLKDNSYELIKCLSSKDACAMENFPSLKAAINRNRQKVNDCLQQIGALRDTSCLKETKLYPTFKWLLEKGSVQ